MRTLMTTAAAAILSAGLVASPTQTAADSFTGSNYAAVELLATCVLADNDARDGVFAEIECEQYMLGFVDALAEVGAAGEGGQTCPPEVNTADEVRWAYMRWVHGDYAKRANMPAADAVMATLKEAFPCGG